MIGNVNIMIEIIGDNLIINIPFGIFHLHLVNRIMPYINNYYLKSPTK
jgi:hypothetical protein